MINNRVYYVELLVDSNCVSSFLEKRECSHAQLIIESRRRMRVEHVLTALMAIWTRGVLRELIYLTLDMYVDAVPHTISTLSVRESSV